jgi:hypothetical protein
MLQSFCDASVDISVIYSESAYYPLPTSSIHCCLSIITCQWYKIYHSRNHIHLDLHLIIWFDYIIDSLQFSDCREFRLLREKKRILPNAYHLTADDRDPTEHRPQRRYVLPGVLFDYSLLKDRPSLLNNLWVQFDFMDLIWTFIFADIDHLLQIS